MNFSDEWLYTRQVQRLKEERRSLIVLLLLSWLALSAVGSGFLLALGERDRERLNPARCQEHATPRTEQRRCWPRRRRRRAHRRPRGGRRTLPRTGRTPRSCRPAG